MWGRHKTILVFSVVCLVGHVILTASAVPSSLENTNGALALLVISIVIMALGAGAIKANVSPLIAEQYTGKLRKEMLPSGETVIKSPALTYQRIYLSIQGSMLLLTSEPLVRYLPRSSLGIMVTGPRILYRPQSLPLYLAFWRRRVNIM